jgi:hypothetical protein
MLTYEELLKENNKLKAEAEEAKEILRGGGLVDGTGKEIPTTLLERAKYMSMIVQSESDMADNFSDELKELTEKYDKLLVNFKDLDRYNDVLHRLFHIARKLRNSGYDGEFIGEATKDLFSAIAEVERYERELFKSRKEKNTNN